MNAHASTRRFILGAALSVVISACSSSALASPDSSGAPSATPPPVPSQVAGSPEPSTPPTPSPSPTPSASPITGIDEIECTGSTNVGNIDWVQGASGGLPDLDQATRALRGLRAADQIVIEDSRSAVVRAGRTVFTGHWFRSASGGWLLMSYEACGDAGISGWPPLGLVRDAMADVAVDGLRVRGLPTIAPDSVKFEQLLHRGDQLFIVDGPVAADGYEWYLVQSLIDGFQPGPFGWVAGASREGEVWIESRERPCPTVPNDAFRFGVLPPELLLHCFGRGDLSFEVNANVYCLPDEVRQVEPAWFGAGCGELSGDACGSCGLSIAADPALGISIPREQSGRWAFQGHFDDPAAATCHGVTAGDTQVPEQFAIHLCRITFVLTSLKRLGDA